jgi:hypothetical protein
VGIAALVTWLQGIGPQLIVLEATGGLQRAVVAALAAAALPVVIGGNLGQKTRDGVRGRQYPLEISGGFEFPAVLYSKGDFSAPGIRSSGVELRNHSVTILNGLTTMILADSHYLPANESRLEIFLPDTTIPNSGSNLRGYQLTVKKVDRSTIPVVILPPSGQKIDDKSEVTLTEQYSWVTVLWGFGHLAYHW